MKYAIINPAQRQTTILDYKDFPAALMAAGLKPGEVDHGALSRTLHVAVDEFGLYKPAASQFYFAVGRRLLAGAAVIYATDEAGETIDLEVLPEIRWFESSREVEYAIELDEINQPCVRLGEEVLWVWPQPAPAGMMPANRSSK